MKNALIFFYNIHLDSIKKIIDNYYFTYQNNDYVVAMYNRNIEEIVELYLLNNEMIKNGVNMYQIIPTIFNNLLFFDNNNYYVLMRIPNIANRIIEFEDIMKFNYMTNLKLTKIDKSNWSYYWEQKIDYVEYQFNQISKKYNNLNETINYYIGIWENAISYYNNNVSLDNTPKYICHKRISTNMDMLEFLNPLNFVIDFKERDIGEYLKSYIYEKKYSFNKLETFYNKLSKNRNDVTRLISRLLFPTQYFDTYENIIFTDNDKDILSIDKKYINYEELLVFTFKYYNKQQVNIPYIDWLIQKMN